MQGSLGSKTPEGVCMLINSIFANDSTMFAQYGWFLHDAVRGKIVLFVSSLGICQCI